MRRLRARRARRATPGRLRRLRLSARRLRSGRRLCVRLDALLASFSGGLAAAAVLFAGYFLSLTGLALAPARLRSPRSSCSRSSTRLAFGRDVRLMGLSLLKMAALVALVDRGASCIPPPTPMPQERRVATLQGAAGVGMAMIPMLFTYNGAIVANFMAAESKNAGRNASARVVAGIAAVAVLYVLVNAGCLRVLGVNGLAHASCPSPPSCRRPSARSGRVSPRSPLP